MQIKRVLKKITPEFLLEFYHYILAFVGAVVFWFPSKNLIVIGVTGTSGKSTTVDFITRILEEKENKVASLSSIRFRINGKEWKNELKMTMPGRFAIQKFLRQAVKENCKYMVLEVTSEGIKQYRHKFINFDTAVFTNLTPEHIESHGGFENYRNEKLKLFSAAKNIHIINTDDENAKYFISVPAKKIITFAIKNRADVEAQQVHGVNFSVNGKMFSLNLLGQFNVYNALSAISVGLSQNIPLEICKKALEKVVGIPGRMEVVAKDPLIVVVDYAHTPVQLEQAYKSLAPKPLVCVLGSCGGGRDKWKRPILGQIAKNYCKEIIITNEDPYDEDPWEIMQQVAAGVDEIKGTKEYHLVLDRKEAIQKAISLAKPGEAVIITGKGSEPLMCFENGKKIPWDDRQIAREALLDIGDKKDAIIVLGGLEKDMRLRVQEAVRLFKEGLARKIIMSGRHAQGKTDSSIITEASFMKDSALDLGVLEDSIILEEKSLNTVENACFSKKILEDNKWKNIVVITSDYHKHRIEYIFGKVLGEGFIIKCIGVKNILSPDGYKKQIQKEKESMSMYQQWFNGIADGDDKTILSSLYKNRPDYKI